MVASGLGSWLSTGASSASVASASGSLSWLSSALGSPIGSALTGPIGASILGGGLGLYELGRIFGWWGRPQFHGSLRPRPNAADSAMNSPTLLSCTFTGKVGLSLASTALDFAGSVPVANEVTGSIQIGAGIVSAGITVYQGNVNSAGFAGTGIGLALAGRTLGKGAAETIPVLGNAVSFLSGVYDVFGSGGVIDTYKSCLVGH